MVVITNQELMMSDLKVLKELLEATGVKVVVVQMLVQPPTDGKEFVYPIHPDMEPLDCGGEDFDKIGVDLFYGEQRLDGSIECACAYIEPDNFKKDEFYEDYAREVLEDPAYKGLIREVEILDILETTKN